MPYPDPPPPRRMVKPITPDEVTELKERVLPEKVIDVWNIAIARKFDGTQAFILQKDIVEKLANAMNVQLDAIYVAGWLDIESLYSDYGWEVIYSKPSYDECFASHFIFKVKKK